MIIILLGLGIVLSARIVKFVVESVVTGSSIGQSLLGSGKGVGQSSPFTVGNRPCDSCCGDYKMLCEFVGQWQRKKGGFRSMSFCVRLKSGVLSA